MGAQEIQFNDGAAYETMMRIWSRSVGERFLRWLRPEPAQRWLDVGCGNGAFTALVAERCAPASVDGLDPSEAQLAFARQRDLPAPARFHVGDAMALPFADGEFEVAMSALAIFFMPDPERGVSEMARVVRPGGMVATYAWDLEGGGFPYEPVRDELRLLGIVPAMAPRPDAARLEELARLWTLAGLEGIDTCVIEVERRFDDTDHYWSVASTTPSFSRHITDLPPEQVARIKQRLRSRASRETADEIVYAARAHAVKGRVPG